jgi:phospholipid/cholesterol/gamma-HCH transport system substrate-binding protein
MENRSHAFAAGSFVLAVSALLVGMAIWLTRDTTVHRVYELSSREAVTGLQPQAGVRFRGVAVGKVMDISFDPVTRGNVLIRISTDDTAPISRSTFGTLGFQGVTGLAFVQLDDTDDSKEPLPTSNAAPGRIPMRAGLLAKLTDQGATLLIQVEETSRRLNELLASDNQKALFNAIQGMGQAADSINQTANRFGQTAVSLQQFSTNADKVLNAQFGPERMNLPQLAKDLSATLKTMQTSLDTVASSMDEVKSSAAEFKGVSKSLTQPGGALDSLTQGAQALNSIGQTINSTTLPRLNRTSDDAAKAARQVSRAVSGVNDNPQALLYGNGAVAPGPGEPGFASPQAKP